MLDLDEFYNRAVFEQKIVIPTDSVYTEFSGDSKGLKIKKVYDVEPILQACQFWRKVNRESNGFTGLREMRHIGKLPFHIFLQITKASGGDAEMEEKATKKYLRRHPEFMCVDNARSI